MSDKELASTIGGGAFPNASFLNAIARGVETIYNLGRAFGTAIRMISSGKKC